MLIVKNGIGGIHKFVDALLSVPPAMYMCCVRGSIAVYLGNELLSGQSNFYLSNQIYVIFIFIRYALFHSIIIIPILVQNKKKLKKFQNLPEIKVKFPKNLL